MEDIFLLLALKTQSFFQKKSIGYSSSEKENDKDSVATVQVFELRFDAT